MQPLFQEKLLIKEKVAFLYIFLNSFKSDFYFTFLGINVINGEEVAIKIEPIRAKHPQLEYEARVYKALAGGGKSKFVFYNGLNLCFTTV